MCNFLFSFCYRTCTRVFQNLYFFFIHSSSLICIRQDYIRKLHCRCVCVVGWLAVVVVYISNFHTVHYEKTCFLIRKLRITDTSAKYMTGFFLSTFFFHFNISPFVADFFQLHFVLLATQFFWHSRTLNTHNM